MTTLREPPAEAIAGMREVARVSTPMGDEDLERFVAWAEATFGSNLVANGDAQWLTLYSTPEE